MEAGSVIAFIGCLEGFGAFSNSYQSSNQGNNTYGNQGANTFGENKGRYSNNQGSYGINQN